MTLAAYTGFRVGARNDDYRVPHLTLILYDFIIVFSSNQNANEPIKDFLFENLNYLRSAGGIDRSMIENCVVK